MAAHENARAPARDLRAPGPGDSRIRRIRRSFPSEPSLSCDRPGTERRTLPPALRTGKVNAMSPLSRPGAAARSPFASLVLLAPLALTVATSASASTLAAYGSYVGEDHSHEDHHSEFLREINLSQANLTATNFRSAELRSAVLVDAIAVDALFTS